MIFLDSSFMRFVNQCLRGKCVVFLLCRRGFHFQIPSFPILNPKQTRNIREQMALRTHQYPLWATKWSCSDDEGT